MQINPIEFLFGKKGAQNNATAGAAGGKRRRLGGLSKLAENMVSDIDTGSDGSINESEFQAFLMKKDPTGKAALMFGRDKRVTALFEKLDVDGDGRIGQKEWDSFQDKIQRVEQYLAEKAAQSVNIRV